MFFNKKRDILGIISNCKSKSRINLAQKIATALNSGQNNSKLPTVNLQGGCFDSTLRGKWWKFDNLIRNYKFFFAFENSNCKDYVTEKFFHHGIQSESVPIVSGTDRKTYEKLAPGTSFIHVDDFDSTEGLVNYLKYLLDNETAYNKFFDWRGLKADETRKNGVRYVTKTEFGHQGFCELCRKLWSPDESPSVIENLDKWWYGNYTNARTTYTKTKPKGYTCK